MGNCTSNKDTINELQGLDNPEENQDEELTFQVEIKNIRARQMPPSTSRIEVLFGDATRTIKFETPEIEESLQNYAWAFHKDFEYKTTKRRLRTATLILNSVEKTGKHIGEVKIPLYEIATGPVHQDFVVKMAKGYKEVGRLNFDVRMSQMIHLTVKTKHIRCEFPDPIKEKYYNFSLRMHSRHIESESDHSTNFKNPLFANDETGEEDFQNVMDENKMMKFKKYTDESKYKPNYDKMNNKPSNPQGIKRVGSNEAIKFANDMKIGSQHFPNSTFDKRYAKIENVNAVPNLRKDVEWDFKQQTSEEAPILKMTVSVDELVSGSFNFFLWGDNETPGVVYKHKTEDEDSHNVMDLKLIGECYVGINKFFFNEAEINFGENKTKKTDKGIVSSTVGNKNHHHIANTSEKLWLHGISVGELIGEFEIENSPFYRQMIVGVRTEEGIQKAAGLYIKKDNASSFFKKTMPREIQNLNIYNDGLKNAIFNLAQSKNPQKNNKLVDEIAETIKRMHTIITSSKKESMSSFVYQNAEDLIESQKLMISVARRLMEYSDNFPITLKPTLYETLTNLLTRGEFELNAMGFKEHEKKALFPDKYKNIDSNIKVDSKFAQKKLKVCENYQTFLYTALGVVLKKLNAKGLPDKERDFVEQFTAVAYFRIPEFREKILAKLLHEDDVKITEWRGTDWNLYDEIRDEKKNKEFVSFFDWDNDLYSVLKDTQMGKVNDKLLKELLQDESWQNRIGKRGIAFYFFLENWAKLVQKIVVVKGDVPWQDLPGYPILLRAFLIKMKTEDVRKWPQAMTQASIALLYNHKLLNPFVSILYNKTKLHDSSSVFHVYEHINNWFSSFRKREKDISTNFDYGYFFKGIYMVLDSEHALNISKCLWLLFNNFNIFPVNIKQNLSVFLLTENFYRLFLHWSWSVRQMFYSLLLYRFYHQHKVLKCGIEDIDQIEKRLTSTNEGEEQTLRKNLLNDFINIEYRQKMDLISSEAEKAIEINNKNRLNANSKIKRHDGTSSVLKRHASAVGFGVNIDAQILEKAKAAEAKTQSETTAKKATRSSSMMFGVEQLNKIQTTVAASVKDDAITNSDKKASAQSIDPQRAKAMVIKRQIFRFGDDKEKDLLNLSEGIPPRMMNYLERGYTEFKDIQAGYEAWAKNHASQLAKMTPAQQEKVMNDPVVPEFSVKVPLDDLETAQSEQQEW